MSFSSLLARGVSRELDRVRRENNRIDRFNYRWERLTQIHQHLGQTYLQQLERVVPRMTQYEHDTLLNYMEEMNAWRDDIVSNINMARQNHLSRYSTSIKKTAVKSLNLCKKYGVAGVRNVAYDAERKCILANGRVIYSLSW